MQTRKTINQKTQNVLRMEEALAAGGVLAGKPENDGALGVVAGAYRSSVAKLGNIAVQQAMQFYQAEHGEMPANYDEFMKWIIKPGQPDGIELAMLPYYQEYSYDEESRQLVVVEFPARDNRRVWSLGVTRLGQVPGGGFGSSVISGLEGFLDGLCWSCRRRLSPPGRRRRPVGKRVCRPRVKTAGDLLARDGGSVVSARSRRRWSLRSRRCRLLSGRTNCRKRVATTLMIAAAIGPI